MQCVLFVESVDILFFSVVDGKLRVIVRVSINCYYNIFNNWLDQLTMVKHVSHVLWVKHHSMSYVLPDVQLKIHRNPKCYALIC